MKPLFLPIVFVFSILAALLPAQADERKAATVILDEAAVKNLGIETVQVEPGEFEETVFVLGRVEAPPDRVAVVASRIPGRVAALSALPGDSVGRGAEVLRLESRQPGNPPPVVALTAPISGTVTRLDVRLGDPVEPDRALAEITDLTELFAVARVPDHVVGRIRAGTTAHIGLPAMPGKNFTGVLVRLGTRADETSGTLDAIFALKNESGAIRPGMRTEFSIVLEKHADVVSVPRSALQGDASSRFVYVKDAELKNAFVKTPVVVGRSDARRVEILSGLQPADEVVTQGAYSLAFVGGGTVSLKAALDAAHGHEHHEDGSEMTPGQHEQGHDDHDHDHGHSDEADDHDHAHDHEDESGFFWRMVSGVLFVLLLVVISTRRKPAAGRKGD